MVIPDFVPGITAPSTTGRQFIVRDHRLLVVRHDQRPTLPVGPVDDRWLYLGQHGETACFALGLAADEPLPGDGELVALRGLFGALPDHDFAIAARALGLTTWDADHRFCGRCGGPTARSTLERARVCARCTLSHFPRVSPAVIALVERDGHALLARNARFPHAFHSCLAGFVEVGETLEATVAREVHEEVGIQVADIRYAGSQPWPFTSSLMIGFTAQYAGGELTPDGDEIVEAGWFAPDALPPLPGAISIARQLIDGFVARHRRT